MIVKSIFYSTPCPCLSVSLTDLNVKLSKIVPSALDNIICSPALDNLNEVIKILDADEIVNHCEGYKGILEVCIHKGDCGIRPLIIGLHQIVNQALSHLTLAQLVGEERKVTETFQQIQKLEKRAASQILESWVLQKNYVNGNPGIISEQGI